MWVRKLYADRNFMMTTEMTTEIYGLRLAICCNHSGIGRGDVAVTKKVMVQQKKWGDVKMAGRQSSETSKLKLQA